MTSRLTTLPNRLATFALLLLVVAACSDPQIEPEVVRVSVRVALGGAPPTTGAQLAIPPSVGSVSLRVETPVCGGDAIYTETQNPTDPDDDVVFSFEVGGGVVACFRVRAFSDADGGGTLLYEGSTSGVDLTGDGPIDVEVALDLVGVTPPTVVTLAPTAVGSNVATLEGTVNPEGFAAVGYFEWGETTDYGSETPPMVVGDGVTAQGISQTIGGLGPGVTYHYRAVGLSSGNRVFGPDQAFTTADAEAGVVVTFPEVPLPTVVTEPATGILPTSVRLNATVNPQGTETGVLFEWGLDGSYGNTTPVVEIGAATSASAIDVVISGLEEGEEYHFRAVAYNAGGLTVGEDDSFVASTSAIDVVFVVDGSASMDAEQTFLVNALNTFASSFPAVHELRVVLIGEQGMCVAPPLGNGTCGDASNPPAYTHLQVGVGSNSALQDVLDTFEDWDPIRRPGGTTMFVVVTDDDSDLSWEDFESGLLALDAGLATYGFSAWVAHSACGALAAAIGVEYLELVAERGGVAGDLCGQDIDPFLAELAVLLTS